MLRLIRRVFSKEMDMRLPESAITLRLGDEVDLHAVARCTPRSHILQSRSSMLLDIPNPHHRYPDLLPRPCPVILPSLSSSLCRYPHFPRYQSLNPRCCPPTLRSLLLPLLHLLSFQTRPRHGSIINGPRQSSFSSSQLIQLITSFLHRFQFHREDFLALISFRTLM